MTFMVAPGPGLHRSQGEQCKAMSLGKQGMFTNTPLRHTSQIFLIERRTLGREASVNFPIPSFAFSLCFVVPFAVVLLSATNFETYCLDPNPHPARSRQ